MSRQRIALLVAAGCGGAVLLLAATSFYLRRAQDTSAMRLPARPVLAWALETLPEPADLRAVSSDARGQAFAVGARGAIVQRTSLGTWLKDKSPTVEDLHAIAAGSKSRLYAVGDRGTVIACDRRAGMWTVEVTPTQENLYAVAVCPGGLCAAGAHGTLLRRDDVAGGWKVVATATTADLHAIAGWVSAPATPSSAPSIGTYVFGDHGTVLVQKVPFGRSQPASAWTSEDSHTTEDLRGATFVGYQIFAVGAHGTLLRRDVSNDEPWTKLPPPEQDALRDVRLVGASDTRILILGERAIYEQRFPEMDGWQTSVTGALSGIDADDRRAIAVGDHGLARVAALPPPPDD